MGKSIFYPEVLEDYLLGIFSKLEPSWLRIPLDNFTWDILALVWTKGAVSLVRLLGVQIGQKFGGLKFRLKYNFWGINKKGRIWGPKLGGYIPFPQGSPFLSLSLLFFRESFFSEGGEI